MFFNSTNEDSGYRIGKATIDMSFHTKSADESFFTYFGNDVLYSMVRTVHTDDIEGFKKIVSSLNSGEIKSTVIRMKGHSGEYRWMIVKLAVNEQMSSADSKYIDLVIKDCGLMENSTLRLEKTIDHFKLLLSVSEAIIFEYSIKTNRLLIYSFNYNCFTTFINEDIDYFMFRVSSQNMVSESSSETFLSFCESLKKGVSRFRFDLETNILTNGEQMQRLIFNGLTVSSEIGDMTVTGTVSQNDQVGSANGLNVVFETNLDPLTKLLNKKAITSYFIKSVESSQKTGKSVSIAIIDIDYFKYINDSFGHLFGDEILRTVSAVLQKEIGSKGVAGRIGGDEFMLVIEDVNNETELRSILRAVRSNAEIMCAEKKEGLHITCSMGISTYPKDALSNEKLFRLADKALYIAKEKGKDRYVIYDVNKHGGLEEEKPVKKTVKPQTVSKSSVVSDLILDFWVNKKMSITQMLEAISSAFELDAVSIYWGSNMDRLFGYSKNDFESKDAYYVFTENYIENFDSDGVFVIDNSDILEGRNVTAYKALTSRNINASVQYIITENDEIKGLITFDLIGHYKKWSTTDINYMKILCRTILRGVENDGFDV
ncbi:MAG: GGDEF domain-containing protein [Oscillospiraceae bacterium]|nr:GGDEF domain-containing protein [Oscillospiraceae bacterium]